MDNSRIHPRIVEAKEGDTVKIDCSSYLVPGYTPTTWFFNNSRLFGLPYFQGPNSSLVYEVIFAVQKTTTKKV